MSVFSEHDKRFEGLEPRSGLFLAIAVLIVAATIVASLVKHGALTPTMRVSFFAQSAQGIHKGMAVQLSGFRIGNVQEMHIEPDARVRVTLAIEKKYAELVPVDSYAGLSKEALIGASFIEIEPSQEKTRTIVEGDVLKFYRVIDFSDMAQELKDKLDPILADVKTITQSINDPNGDIRKTIHNAQQATALIAELRQELIEVIRRSDGRFENLSGKLAQVLDQSGATLERARGALDSASRSLDTVERQLPGLLLRLDQSLKNVEAATANANRIAAGLAEELPPAIREGRSLVEDTQEIVDAAKQAWPIRNLVPPAGQKALPLDSYDTRSPK